MDEEKAQKREPGADLDPQGGVVLKFDLDRDEPGVEKLSLHVQVRAATRDALGLGLEDVSRRLSEALNRIAAKIGGSTELNNSTRKATTREAREILRRRKLKAKQQRDYRERRKQKEAG